MMLDVVGFSRALMGFSLAVHILFVVIGISLPLVILITELAYARSKDKDYSVLAKRLTTAFILFFAVGTASGTVVALELLFLWPKFMALVSQVAILPLISESFIFFTEAIFLSIYIYFRQKIRSPYVRALVILIVAISAALSGAFITMINAFMNTPVGFNIPAYLQNGTITDVSPLAVFNSPSSGLEIIHVLLTSYFAGAFLLLAYFSFSLIKSRNPAIRNYYKKVVKLLFWIAAVSIPFIILTGSLSITQLYALQPEKYAALEADLISQSHAPEIVGGIYANGTLKDYILIPDLQSILATGSPNGVVPGLNQFPESTWPPLFVHLLFDIVVFCGFALGFFILLVVLLILAKRSPLQDRRILWLFVLCGFVAAVVVECGWTMAEVGRQPWIIYNVMTVAEAGNPSAGIIPIGILIALFYVVVCPLSLYMLKRVFDGRPLAAELRSGK